MPKCPLNNSGGFAGIVQVAKEIELKDEHIRVDMVLTSQTHLHLEGSVAHREWPLGFGLRFAHFTDDKAALLSRVAGAGG